MNKNTMPALTDEHRQILSGLCRIEIKRWKTACESNQNMRYMVELMEIALASLEAEPECWEIAGQIFPTREEALKPGYRGAVYPLYAEPPVPALNLPEPEKETGDLYASEINSAIGWNNCLAEVKKLNGVTE